MSHLSSLGLSFSAPDGAMVPTTQSMGENRHSVLYSLSPSQHQKSQIWPSYQTIQSRRDRLFSRKQISYSTSSPHVKTTFHFSVLRYQVSVSNYKAYIRLESRTTTSESYYSWLKTFSPAFLIKTHQTCQSLGNLGQVQSTFLSSLLLG